MTVRLISTFAIALIVSACGGGGGGGDNNGGGNPPPVPPTALEGTWLKPCGIAVGEEASPTPVYNVIMLTVKDKVIDTSIENYTEDDCNDGSFLSIATSKATIVIGKELDIMGQAATEVDTIVQSSTGATFNDTYNIFTISNTNILYLGAFIDPKDGSEPAKRPDTIDFFREYFLQSNP